MSRGNVIDKNHKIIKKKKRRHVIHVFGYNHIKLDRQRVRRKPTELQDAPSGITVTFGGKRASPPK